MMHYKKKEGVVAQLTPEQRKQLDLKKMETAEELVGLLLAGGSVQHSPPRKINGHRGIEKNI
jgi:hypothetical protein